MMRGSLIAGLIFALDRWTKHLVETRLSPYEAHTVIPGMFDIVRSSNTGVAFGLFAESSSELREILLIVFSLGAMVILAMMLWRSCHANGTGSIALARIFGGSAGNVFDRVRVASVTDFLAFYRGSHHWYTFNLADTAISVGAGLLLLSMLRRPAVEKKRAQT